MPKKVLIKSESKAPDFIKRLEDSRNSKVIVYITGDRLIRSGDQIITGLSTQVSVEVLPFFDEILKSFDETQKISLVIYTNGGLIETPWPLVSTIRQYCKEFEVIVFRKSLSAGTLIALGGDKIVMPRGSFLSPIDPATEK